MEPFTFEIDVQNTMNYYVGVMFSGTNKSYYFCTDFDDLKIGDFVVVETVSGTEIGEISTELKSIEEYHSQLQLKPILRKATNYDLSAYEQNLKESAKALEITKREVEKLGLPMNLTSANYTLNRDKITINFTSEGRVDFRELLKILAPQLHCRIELHQMQTRDRARMVGGIGICGLPLCCTTFLNDFDGVGINLAKNQMLTINIPKLSGHCGKLLCCLAFEDDMYTEAKRHYPSIGTPVHLMEGDFVVAGFNILSRTVKLSNAETVKFLTLEEYNNAANRNNRKNNQNKERQFNNGPRPKKDGN